MASCSPCRFMFGDNIMISAGMEPMLYPDCERERAVGLRGGHPSGYRVNRAAGVARRAVLRGYRVSQAAGAVRRAVLRGYRVSRAAGAVRRAVLRGYWVSRAAGAARPVFRCDLVCCCDLVRRCDLWPLRHSRTRHRCSIAICCSTPLALSRALCRICAATAVRLRTA